jgi:CheY-like chemotaxis protein
VTATATAGRTGRAPVLVVEDHDDTREMVAMLLSAHGFNVVTAENGQRGLERLMQARPCLVLLDLMMPVMTGWEFRRVQMSLPDSDLAAVPVLLLTAVSEPERAAEQLHVAEIITKPLDFEQLITAVQRYCR